MPLAFILSFLDVNIIQHDVSKIKGGENLKRRDWLIEKREKKGMSQSEIARLVNVTSQMYNYIESGKRRPKPELAKKIADILNFSWTRFYE